MRILVENAESFVNRVHDLVPGLVVSMLSENEVDVVGGKRSVKQLAAIGLDFLTPSEYRKAISRTNGNGHNKRRQRGNRSRRRESIRLPAWMLVVDKRAA